MPARPEAARMGARLRSDDFQFLADMLKQQSGLLLSPDQIYMLEQRLAPVARKLALNSVDDICHRLRTTHDPRLIESVIESMATTDTKFFRDIRPFEQFEQVLLPMLITQNANKKSIRIWSAGTASGQEAYSLAMILHRKQKDLTGWNLEIMGTDLSKPMIDQAAAGIYTQFEIQRGLPARMLVDYFHSDSDRWRIDQQIKDLVKFRTHNLMHDFTPLSGFDLVFCRNVLSYFDVPTRTRVLDAIHRLLPPHGILVLGNGESILGISDKFKPLEGQRGVYVQKTYKGVMPNVSAIVSA